MVLFRVVHGTYLSRVFLRRLKDPIRVPRIRENYHRVPKIRENRVPRIREIGSPQIQSGFLPFSLKKTWFICPIAIPKQFMPVPFHPMGRFPWDSHRNDIPTDKPRVVHGTSLSVPFPSHSNLCLSHPIPSHGTFPMGFPSESHSHGQAWYYYGVKFFYSSWSSINKNHCAYVSALFCTIQVL